MAGQGYYASDDRGGTVWVPPPPEPTPPPQGWAENFPMGGGVTSYLDQVGNTYFLNKSDGKYYKEISAPGYGTTYDFDNPKTAAELGGAGGVQGGYTKTDPGPNDFNPMMAAMVAAPLLMGLGGASAGLAEGFGGAGILGDSAMWGLGEAAAAGAAGSGAMDWSNLGDLWDYAGGGTEIAPQNVVDLFNNAGMPGYSNYGQSLEELAAELFNNAGTPGFDQYGNEASGLDWIKSQFGGPGSTTSTATNALKTLFGGSGAAGAAGGGTDWMKLLGGLGAAGLGAYASNKQTSALEDMAGRYEGYGAPYRQKLSDLYANPDSFLQSNEVQKPVQQGTNMLMRSLSMQGNPFGSGNALQQGQSYASDQLFGKLGQEKDRLAGFGGLATYNAAAPTAATNAIGSSSNTYNAIGSGLGNIFNPPQTGAQTMADFMKALKG